jgi:hypothetical protein
MVILRNTRGLKLAELRDRKRVAGPMEDAIKKEIERLKPSLISLDPFVKTHALDENTSGDMDFVCSLLADIAVEYSIAVDSPHHVHKGTIVPGDAESGRGSSGIRDAGRLVYTLTPMSEQQGATFNIKDRRPYIRLDSAKVNIVARSSTPDWFRLVGVEIGNGTDIYPNGDTVQVAEPWRPPDVWAGATVPGLNTVLDHIARGPVNDEDKPTGQRYSNAPNAAHDKAAWLVVQEAYPEKAEGQCREIINAWLASGLLYAKNYDDPVARKSRKGLYVNDAKRPS